ncbi:MAG: AtpZ/AtpI family protein [Campylobacteraceae bacterium]|jgi:F0F1-type ATP synthase assembly protein I|nr:AtpZ/AtpI family protein [Campylobacteraceae bacterium]
MNKDKKEPKYGKIIEGADQLSLGLSMVVAVVIGVAAGFWLREITSEWWTLWLGVFWGIGAAVYNVYKAYLRQKKSYDELKNEPRYKYNSEDKEEDDKY